MSDYQYLNHVVKIQDYSSLIQKIDLKQCKIKKNKPKIEKYEDEKEKLLTMIETER